MSTFTRWLAPVRQLAAAFFRHEVTLKREQGGALHVVLAERTAAPRPGTAGKADRAEGDKRRRHEETMLVRTELAALLNELPETRTTMRHLVFVEQAIAKKGLKVLHKVPLDVLRRAHDQLENLVINWSAAGLANLRSKMAVAIIDREHMDPDAEADAYRTAAVLDGGDEAMPRLPLEEAPPRDDDAALAAAYAALGNLAPNAGDLADGFVPATVEMQGELGSVSARALLRPQSRAYDSEPTEISVRVLQP
ncbi:MAG: hypothetical protein HZC37_08915 [Burkholderiales bacterium]|nr:hypothetical protein [Burkholderiales bacterium]